MLRELAEASRGAVFGAGEERPDLTEGQAGPLRRGDRPQPVEDLGPVAARTVLAVRRRQDADRFVVADGRGADAGEAGDGADREGGDTGLDFERG